MSCYCPLCIRPVPSPRLYGKAEPFRAASIEVLAAWDNAGPMPAYHARAKRQLRREWPALAGALDLLSATARNNPEPID